MKKLFQPKTVSLIIVAALTFLTAQVPAFAAQGSFENDGTDYEARIVVITDSLGTEAVFCNVDFLEYRAVIINPAGGPAFKTTVGINPSENVSAGDRFDIQSPSQCNGRINAILIRISQMKPHQLHRKQSFR